MKLLALDQASHTTGYAVFEDGKPIVISHFEAHGDELGDRLVDIRNHIINLINQYEIDTVAFEDIQLQDVKGSKEVGIKTFKMLAEVFGVVYELLHELEIDYYIIPPIVWKATFKIAGKGRTAEKKMAQAWVSSNYNLNCTEDEADAVCLGTHVIKLENSEKNSDYDWA